MPAPRTEQPPTAPSPGHEGAHDANAGQEPGHTPSSAQQGAQRHVRATTARQARRGHHRPEPEQLTLPGIDEWVQEQLSRAPARSREWARRVAAIYGLQLPDD